MILERFDTEANFWKLHPQLQIPQEFAMLSIKKIEAKQKAKAHR